MIIAVDETGDFKATPTANVGLVVLVSITDEGYNKLLSFLNVIFPNGLSGIKSNAMTEKQRRIVLNYIAHKPYIKYTAVLFDLSSGGEKSVQAHRNGQIEKIKSAVEEKKSLFKASYLEDIKLLINQIGAYSISDYARFVMFFELFMGWQRVFMFDYINTERIKDSWNMNITIDTQNKPNKFLRLLKSYLTLTTHNNPNFTIMTPAELGTDHPYLLNHSYENNLELHDGKKFFKDMKIGDDKQDPCLLLPDLIGHTIQKSIKQFNNGLYIKDLYRIRNNRSIALTLKNPNSYFTILGFDKSKGKKDVADILKAHHYTMRKFESSRKKSK